MSLNAAEATNRQETKRALPPEAPVAFTLNGEGYGVFMATPQNLEDFAVGFALSEAIIHHPDDLTELKVRNHKSSGFSVDMTLSDELFFAALKRKRQMTGVAGCGLCGLDSIHAILRELRPLKQHTPPSVETLAACFERLQQDQDLNAYYGGGLHAAGVWSQGTFIAVREDIGRHNAMDKALGAGARHGAPVDLVITTSRCSSDLVQKAVCARVHTLAVMATPSDLAVKLAQDTHLNLFSCNRGHSFIRYN